MAYSTSIADSLLELFTQLSIHADFEEKGAHGLFSIRMRLHGSLQMAKMTIIVREDSFSTLTTVPVTVDERVRHAAAEYLTRANWNMRSGNFELNMDNGEIRFKTYVHAGGSALDAAVARHAVLLPFMMFDRYGDGLLDVLFSLKTPKEAFDALSK